MLRTLHEPDDRWQGKSCEVNFHPYRPLTHTLPPWKAAPQPRSIAAKQTRVAGEREARAAVSTKSGPFLHPRKAPQRVLAVALAQ